MPGPLGRRPPTDDEHLQKYPLRGIASGAPFDATPDKPTPIVIGAEWFPVFDSPVRGRDGRWRVAQPPKWQSPRGGHAFALKHKGCRDTKGLWRYYNQGEEGACTCFAGSRVQSWQNRGLFTVPHYDAFTAYRATQLRDEFRDTPPAEGTSVRAMGETLRIDGLGRVSGSRKLPPDPANGIVRYRWARDVEEAVRVLGWGDVSEVPFANSWGEDGYPQEVFMSLDTVDWLTRRPTGADLMVVTDR